MTTTLCACVTDTATRYSQKCCEELVAAGAIDTILKLIQSVSRSIPDQEVLKHSLSTLRNLARYPHLTEVLIDSKGSIQTVLWEFLRFVLKRLFILLIFLLWLYSYDHPVNIQKQRGGIFHCCWAFGEVMLKSKRNGNCASLASSLEEVKNPCSWSSKEGRKWEKVS